ncbi:MAG: hypothetical protein HYZ00_06335, partial [Candidatus Hydrogenedentes bacterium]|nr:hypothetical protein [Candidatus Hydrogenedentota bacterium]
MLPSLLVPALFGLLTAEVSSLPLEDGWRFAPDTAGAGEAAAWFAPAFDDSAWAEVKAGMRWEDQGFPAHDGWGWDRKHVEAPPAWQGQRVWLVLGGVNDACVVYCNGARVNSFGEAETVTVAETALFADLSAHLRFGADNLIAIAVYDRGGSGGLWRLPCELTLSADRLLATELFSIVPDYEAGKVHVSADLLGLGNEQRAVTLEAELRHDSDDPRTLYAEARVRFAAGEAPALELPLQAAAMEKGVKLYLRLNDAAGERVLSSLQSIAPRRHPQWSQPHGDLKVRNNFVTELAKFTAGELKGSFQNPRDGWVLFRYAASGGVKAEALPQLALDGTAGATTWRRDEFAPATFQWMQRLAAGEHALTVTEPLGGVLEVLAIPELAFCYFPTDRHLEVFGPYDWAWMERHALSAVNTIVSHGDAPEDPFQSWRDEGRTWIANSSLPGLGDETPPDPQRVYEAWAAAPGALTPGYSGLIVDEFVYASPGHFASWTDAIRRLYADPRFSGKTFYAWSLDLYEQPHSLEFSRALYDLGGRFSWEKYLPSEPSEQMARLNIQREIAQPFAEWVNAMPGIEQRLLICLGIFSAPPETLNLDPACDYQVMLDLQMHALATDPTFFGLGGVMGYLASYTDEEVLRWTYRLFHHYAIEGHTERLTNTPYRLAYLQNPDFKDGLDGWTLHPAAEGSIKADKMEGFSFLSGRYPPTPMGDQFCLFTRQ